MDTLELTDRHGDTLEVLPLTGCDREMSGSIDLNLVHLEPPQQRQLALWLNEHLMLAGHEPVWHPLAGESLATTPAEREAWSCIELEHGETTLRIDKGMGLTENAILTLARAAFGAGSFPADVSSETMATVALALGLPGSTPHGEIIAAARAMRTDWKDDVEQAEEGVRQERDELRQAIDALSSTLVLAFGLAKGLAPARVAEMVISRHHDLQAELARAHTALRGANGRLQALEREIGYDGTDAIDAVRTSREVYREVRQVFPNVLPSHTATELRGLIASNKSLSEARAATRARAEQLEAALRDLRSDFTANGEPVATGLDQEDSDSIVQRIDAALEG